MLADLCASPADLCQPLDLSRLPLKPAGAMLRLLCPQAELARLRKQHAERTAARAQEVLADLAQGPAPAASPQGSPGPTNGLSEAELMRTVKVGFVLLLLVLLLLCASGSASHHQHGLHEAG